MVSGASIIAVYDTAITDDVLERTLAICRKTGFSVEADQMKNSSENDYFDVQISYGSKSTTLQFNQDDDRTLDEPVVSFGRMVYPEKDDVSPDEHREEIEATFELICRLAIDLEAAYIPLFDSERRSMSVVPTDRPIADAIDQPPRLGVYSNSVLEDLGGIEGLFETTPWYVADLDGDRTLVIESESPWTGWRPPTDAPYIEEAQFHEPEAEDSDDGLTLSDPFAALAAGEYGVDACVSREDIAAEFRNEDLQLVRVYVDEERNLRRVADDSFVRNVVDADLADDEAVIQAQLANIPADATDDDLMVSALLHGAIPPSFVRLDDPDDETVVSRVLDLDVETNKVDLLISLGRAAQHEDGMDPATIEGALASLADLEAVDGIEGWIEANLL